MRSTEHDFNGNNGGFPSRRHYRLHGMIGPTELADFCWAQLWQPLQH